MTNNVEIILWIHYSKNAVLDENLNVVRSYGNLWPATFNRHTNHCCHKEKYFPYHHHYHYHSRSDPLYCSDLSLSTNHNRPDRSRVCVCVDWIGRCPHPVHFVLASDRRHCTTAFTAKCDSLLSWYVYIFVFSFIIGHLSWHNSGFHSCFFWLAVVFKIGGHFILCALRQCRARPFSFCQFKNVHVLSRFVQLKKRSFNLFCVLNVVHCL